MTQNPIPKTEIKSVKIGLYQLPQT